VSTRSDFVDLMKELEARGWSFATAPKGAGHFNATHPSVHERSTFYIPHGAADSRHLPNMERKFDRLERKYGLAPPLKRGRRPSAARQANLSAAPSAPSAAEAQAGLEEALKRATVASAVFVTRGASLERRVLSDPELDLLQRVILSRREELRSLENEVDQLLLKLSTIRCERKEC